MARFKQNANNTPSKTRWLVPEDCRELDQAMEIYAASFPANETRPVPETLDLLRKPDDSYRLYVIEDGKEVAGMALVYCWDDFTMLDYMAVKDGRRGGGEGSSMFRSIARQLDFRPMLIEIEMPDSSEQAAMRERFYSRLGACTISDTYVMPSYEGMPPETMLLMAVSTSGCTERLKRETVRGFIERMYADVYGRINPVHVEESMRPVEPSVLLEPVPQKTAS